MKFEFEYDLDIETTIRWSCTTLYLSGVKTIPVKLRRWERVMMLGEEACPIFNDFVAIKIEQMLHMKPASHENEASTLNFAKTERICKSSQTYS